MGLLKKGKREGGLRCPGGCAAVRWAVLGGAMLPRGGGRVPSQDGKAKLQCLHDCHGWPTAKLTAS